MTYALPLRRWRLEPLDELSAYLTRLATQVEVIVVDGSAPDLFDVHRAALPWPIRHLPVDPALRGGNEKVGGVLTAVRAATHDAIVIADDDVRYGRGALRDMARRLASADLVRPQNYFDPLPWHARWDSGRMLLNRALAHDYPGTLGVMRPTLLRAGGYDADVLFENLELIRTIGAVGGRIADASDLFVRRLPPTPRHFWGQRVRQAYDSFAQPPRLLAELAVLPMLAAGLRRRRAGGVVGGAVAVAAVAERGRRRDGGTTVFPPSCSLIAPLWVAERGVCAWLALALRLARGGVPYAGTTIRRAANSKRALKRRLRP